MDDQPDRRGSPRQELGVSEELEDALDLLADDNPRTESALRLLWRDMAAYAIENGHRLDRANVTIRRLVQVILLVAGLIVVIMLVTGFVVIKLQNDQTDQTMRIQQSRLESCQDTNGRHDKAVAALNTLETESVRSTPIELEGLLRAIGRPLSPGAERRLAAFERAQPSGSDSAVVSLVNAVVPRRPCRSLIYGAASAARGGRGPAGATGGIGATGSTGATGAT